jgi:hypothetical protein
MALGIKKITESVVEDDRSLIMLGKYNPFDDKIAYDDNKAVPQGAIIASPTSNLNDAGTLRIKSDEGVQVKINGHSSIAPSTITRDELADHCIMNIHLNASNAKDSDRTVADYNIRDFAISTTKIKDGAVTSIKLANNSIKNNHLTDNCIESRNLINNAIVTDKIKDKAVTAAKLADDCAFTNHIANNSITRIKIAPEVRFELDGYRADIEALKQALAALRAEMLDLINALRKEFDDKLRDLENRLLGKITNIDLSNVVMHNNYDIVGGTADGKYTSTPLSDIKCSGNITCAGDINGQRVYFMTYQDLAEAYEPGEDLEAGMIVAVREDGKVYKANTTDNCIVGVISDEFANCLGATKEELFSGKKVAVGMIGKVHVKVKGPIKLGQSIGISSSDEGIGYGLSKTSNMVGIGKALESIDCDFDEVHEILVQIRPM